MPQSSPASETPETELRKVDEQQASEMVLAATLRGIRGTFAGQSIFIPETLAQTPKGRITLTIGRDKDNAVPFPNDNELGFRHAEVYRIEGRWFCRDLSTRTGTLVGSKPLRGSATEVAPGTVITVGAQQFALEYALPTSSQPAPAAAPTREITREPYPPSRADSDDPFLLDGFLHELQEFETALFGRGRAKRNTGQEKVRFVGPGQSVEVGGVTIPNALIYVGKGLRSLEGYAVEPALVNPGLKLAPAPLDLNRLDHASLNRLFDYYHYYRPTYAEASPLGRRTYLQWLADGRKHPHTPEPFLLLFFYGLERRLLDLTDPDIEDDAECKVEVAQLLGELERLQTLYSHHVSWLRAVITLQSFLQARNAATGALPDPQILLDVPKSGQSLPALLEVVLARFARQKQPLPAPWALAWVVHDPDAPGIRSAITRCKSELTALWNARYAETFKTNGVKMTVRKFPLQITYRPASPAMFGWVMRPVPGNLHGVGVAPLKQLRPLLDACCNELAPYSRLIGRRAEWRGSPLAATLLPLAAREAHEPTRALTDRLRHEFALPNGSVLPTVRTYTGLSLLALLTGQEQTESLSRADTVLMAQCLEQMGFALEPDVRRGSPTPTLADTFYVAPLLFPPDIETADKQAEDNKRMRPFLLLLASVVGGQSDASAVNAPAFALALTQITGQPEATPRYAVLLTYLLSQAEPPRPPRQFAGGTDLRPDTKARMGELLVDAAFLQGGKSASATASPDLVRRLAQGYRLLDLDEARLYDRLHHLTTATLSRIAEQTGAQIVAALTQQGQGSDTHADDLTTVQSAAPAPGYELPPAPEDDAPQTRKQRTGKTARPLLDHGAIERKLAETEQVNQLLGAIFEEPAPTSIPTATPTVVPPVAPADSATESAQAPHLLLLAELLTQPLWSADEFARLARHFGLLPGAALEAINEEAWAIADEAALEGADPIEVNEYAARSVLGAA